MAPVNSNTDEPIQLHVKTWQFKEDMSEDIPSHEMEDSNDKKLWDTR